MDTPTLRMLAGEDATQVAAWEASRLLGRVLTELGLERPTLVEAVRFVGMKLTRDFLEHGMSPIAYARAVSVVWGLTCDADERPGEFDPLIYAESEWGGPVEELEKLSEGIWATARDLVRSAPKLWTEMGPPA